MMTRSVTCSAPGCTHPRGEWEAQGAADQPLARLLAEAGAGRVQE